MTGRSIEEITEAVARAIRADTLRGFGGGYSFEDDSPSTWEDYRPCAEAALTAADVSGLLDRLEQAEARADHNALAVNANADMIVDLRAERDRLRAQVEAVEATVRRQVARDLAAWLDAVFAPPIWHRAVSIADPTFCVKCPHCDNSWEGCEHCDGGFIEDGPVGPQPTEPKEEA